MNANGKHSWWVRKHYFKHDFLIRQSSCSKKSIQDLEGLEDIERQLTCPQTSQINYSSEVYYKVRWQLLQSATAFFITKCDNLLLQSATAILLQSVTSFITKCDRYYKVRRFYYKVRQVLQSVTIITKCDRTQ